MFVLKVLHKEMVTKIYRSCNMSKYIINTFGDRKTAVAMRNSRHEEKTFQDFVDAWTKSKFLGYNYRIQFRWQIEIS